MHAALHRSSTGRPCTRQRSCRCRDVAAAAGKSSTVRRAARTRQQQVTEAAAATKHTAAASHEVLGDGWAAAHLPEFAAPQQPWQPSGLLPDTNLSTAQLLQQLAQLRHEAALLPSDLLVVLVSVEVLVAGAAGGPRLVLRYQSTCMHC